MMFMCLRVMYSAENDAFVMLPWCYPVASFRMLRGEVRSGMRYFKAESSSFDICVILNVIMIVM